MIFACIDFETTGLPLAPRAAAHLQPRAIEFAAVLCNQRGEVVGEHQLLINPERALEPVITKITGLTTEDVSRAPPFLQVWPAMQEALAGVDVMVAHNMSFDAYILACELRRAKITSWAWPRLACTVELFQPLWGRRMKLIELYEATTGRAYAQTHRALDDVRALMEIVTSEEALVALAATASADRAYLPPELCTH